VDPSRTIGLIRYDDGAESAMREYSFGDVIVLDGANDGYAKHV
jgi:hypothetical protein